MDLLQKETILSNHSLKCKIFKIINGTPLPFMSPHEKNPIIFEFITNMAPWSKNIESLKGSGKIRLSYDKSSMSEKRK